MPEGHAEAGDSVVRVVRTGRSAGACSGALVGPREAGVYELAGFGTEVKPRNIPLTGWYVSSVTRHMFRGPVIGTTDGVLTVELPGAPGDSGGPIVDVATGRIAAVVSRGRTGDSKEEGAAPRVAGARLMACKKSIAAALAR